MTPLLKNENSHFLIQFEDSLNRYLSLQGQSRLVESIAYSLKSKGKRFRPFLAYLVLRTLDKSFELAQSWFLAIEFIHTYSLIHDDLPCMDNDDYRRGVLTNHKVYGEDIALLAGDSLISEAFRLIAEDKSLSANTRVRLIQLLARKIGPDGMVGGQVLDMQATKQLNIIQLKNLHILKTGNLIQAAALGAAEILEYSPEQINQTAEFSLHLGLAFQIKDDLLDYKSSEQDFKNYASLLGLETAQAELQKHSVIAIEYAQKFTNHQALIDLIQFNLSRTS